jgi:hypothetical protein
VVGVPAAGAAAGVEDDELPLPLSNVDAVLASPLVIAVELGAVLAAQYAGAPRVGTTAMAALVWRVMAERALPAIAIVDGPGVAPARMHLGERSRRRALRGLPWPEAL